MQNRYFDYPVAHQPDPSDTDPTELRLLAESSSADWSLLLDYGQRRQIEAGETLIEQDTPGRSLMIVLAGRLRIVARNRRRSGEAVVRSLGAGDIVGEVGFAVGGQRSNTIIADEQSEIFELDWQSLQQLAAAHPALGVRFLSDVLTIVAARTRAAERR